MNSHPELHTLFTKEQIKSAVNRLAAEITQKYHDKDPVLVGILKGVFVFMADLSVISIFCWKWSLSTYPAMAADGRPQVG